MLKKSQRTGILLSRRDTCLIFVNKPKTQYCSVRVTAEVQSFQFSVLVCFASRDTIQLGNFVLDHGFGKGGIAKWIDLWILFRENNLDTSQ